MVALDLKTILAMTALNMTMMAIVLFTASRSYPQSVAGTGKWALGALGLLLTAVGYSMQGTADLWVSVAIPNALFLGAFLLMWFGTHQLFGKHLRWKPYLGGYIAIMVLLTYWTVVSPFVAGRSITIAGLSMYFYVGQMVLIWRTQERGPSEIFFGILCLLGFSSTTWRTVASILGGADAAYFMRPDLVQRVYLGTFAFLSIVHPLAFYIMATRRMHAELEKLALTDPLTGVLNRRAMNNQLSADVSTACRKRQWLSVLALDLDYFKNINDQYGHDVGDAVLRQFTEIVSGQKRSSDSFARLGGEEFILILPGTDVKEAVEVATRIQQSLRPSHANGLPNFTTSCGISGRLFEPTSLEAQKICITALLKRADQALYTAKQNGRNRIETTDSEQGWVPLGA